jgi:Flp pilus assembly protein TadG
MSNMSIPDSKRLQGNLNIGQQHGVVAVIVALSMVVLVGFVGLALDLGKLFVTKTELQNSADACALAAARELTGTSNNQLTLAEEAGITAGTSNNVQFQQDSVSIGSNNITFSDALDGTYLTKDAVANVLSMRFARCTVQRSDIANWFVQVLGIGAQQVNATAVASLVPSQTTCAMPVAVCVDKLAGKEPGDWLDTLLDPGEGLTGDFLWASFASKSGAKAMKDLITNSGECNLPTVGESVGTPGSIASAYDAWNTRFGVYKGSYNKTNAEMDFTGYAYTAKSWPSCEKAYIGGDFIAKRTANEPMQDPSRNTTGLKVVPPADSSTTIEHSQGGDRRIVAVPVVNCDDFTGASHQAEILSWACVLMLHPLDQNADADASACPGKTGNRAFLEYLGLANDPNSPCATAGMAGGPGSIGPLVPALVQ